MSQINFSPLSRSFFLAFMIGVQVLKLIIILSQPDKADFTVWYFAWPHNPPYTFWFKNPQGYDALAAPYSLLWYVFNAPAYWGYFPVNFYYLAIDCAFAAVIMKYESQFFGWFYVQTSLYFLLASPQDFFILLLMILGKERWPFLVIAPLAKAPMIPPILDSTLWNFILYSPASLHDPGNWARYTLIGICWTVCLLLYLRNHTNKATKLFNTLEYHLRVR